MSSAQSKRLVIDASVATSTGERGGRGERCQAFLRVMIDETYHRLVMTREIGEEWDKRFLAVLNGQWAKFINILS
jgi:hypothetical protein